MEGLEYIAKTTNCIDMSRVAIHGWSYGMCTVLQYVLGMLVYVLIFM